MELFLVKSYVAWKGAMPEAPVFQTVPSVLAVCLGDLHLYTHQTAPSKHCRVDTG